MAFDQERSPVLPAPPNQYTPAYFNQLLRTIGRYFNTIDSKMGITHERVTAGYLNLPIHKYTAVNGTTNDAVFPRGSFVRIEGPTGAFTFTGIVKGTDGEIRTLFNSTAQNMTISNQSASSSAENRIITNTGADIVTTGSGVVTLIYSVEDSRWVVLSSQL